MVCPNWLLASLLPGRHCIVGGSVLVMAGALVRGLARVRRNGTAIPIRVECLPLSAAPVRGAVLQSGCRSLSGVDSSCAWGGGNRDSTRFLLPSPCHPLMAQVGRRRRLATASEILCRVSVNSFLGKAMGRTSWTPPSTILKTVFPGGGIAEIMERPVHREGCSDWLLGHSPGRQGGLDLQTAHNHLRTGKGGMPDTFASFSVLIPAAGPNAAPPSAVGLCASICSINAILTETHRKFEGHAGAAGVPGILAGYWLP